MRPGETADCPRAPTPVVESHVRPPLGRDLRHPESAGVISKWQISLHQGLSLSRELEGHELQEDAELPTFMKAALVPPW
jgi:hypothetical protein